jgi:hypothetical protein
MKIRILNHNSENCTITAGHFFRDIIKYFSRLFKDSAIEWGDSGDILAVTNVDLDKEYNIQWSEINIVFAETCQQIYDLSYKLDQTKAYIFVTESWVNFDHLKEKFYGLPLIAHYAVFNEVFNYGYELFSIKSHLSTVQKSKDPAEHDFFCLIGRQSTLRGRFIHDLARHDLSNSLVKYNGSVVGNSGVSEKLDCLDYKSGFFDTAADSDMLGMLPSKLIQSSLYNNFKAEIQFETDSVGGRGWDLTEYHVTEKTLKPLIMSKPCVMYGPVGYLQWLQTFGIDLGHGNFDIDYDSITNDQQRAQAVAEQIKKIDFDKVVPSTEHYHRNLVGLHQMCDLSKENTVNLYRHIRRL